MDLLNLTNTFLMGDDQQTDINAIEIKIIMMAAENQPEY
jgi:hypothetical protein